MPAMPTTVVAPVTLAVEVAMSVIVTKVINSNTIGRTVAIVMKWRLQNMWGASTDQQVPP